MSLSLSLLLNSALPVRCSVNGFVLCHDDENENLAKFKSRSIYVRRRWQRQRIGNKLSDWRCHFVQTLHCKKAISRHFVCSIDCNHRLKRFAIMASRSRRLLWPDHTHTYSPQPNRWADDDGDQKSTKNICRRDQKLLEKHFMRLLSWSPTSPMLLLAIASTCFEIVVGEKWKTKHEKNNDEKFSIVFLLCWHATARRARQRTHVVFTRSTFSTTRHCRKRDNGPGFYLTFFDLVACALFCGVGCGAFAALAATKQEQKNNRIKHDDDNDDEVCANEEPKMASSLSIIAAIRGEHRENEESFSLLIFCAEDKRRFIAAIILCTQQ